MSRGVLSSLICLSLALLSLGSGLRASPAQAIYVPQEPPATFSILGYDPATGEVGGAVQSRVFSVGNGVLWAEAGVGAAATQAIVDVSYGPKALDLLRAGMTPAAIVPATSRIADPNAARPRARSLVTLSPERVGLPRKRGGRV